MSEIIAARGRYGPLHAFPVEAAQTFMLDIIARKKTQNRP
jgi:hypothetical protein